MAGRCLFVTGATGFIGRRVLHRLGGRAAAIEEVRCLTRRPDRLPPGLPDNPRIAAVTGTVEEPRSYESALRGVDTVVHLAGLTGKAREADYFLVNTEGTRRLLEACHHAGAPQFLHVSSVAARFEHATAYHYAKSKAQAEQLVRQSALPYVIVRPTIVLGPGSPIGRLLTSLGSSPIVPLPGDGRCRVQPVFVDDLADCLVALMNREFANDEVEIGGPEVATLDRLVARVRERAGKSSPRIVHLPIAPAVALLARLETWRIPLPVTAGQLSVFVNDTSARPSAFLERHQPAMIGIDEMLGLQHART
jgi:nucleoside-diphosphate-sugar epimerase